MYEYSIFFQLSFTNVEYQYIQQDEAVSEKIYLCSTRGKRHLLRSRVFVLKSHKNKGHATGLFPPSLVTFNRKQNVEEISWSNIHFIFNETLGNEEDVNC